ncbi:CbiQ family ECF transporter T component [Georgenia sp. AZ-5]|uniref:CbiQ family ECF transporter T component n=1 Tax=Georgenia sp. AZ-5 TaxID=3367526 RepID=UPI003754054D
MGVPSAVRARPGTPGPAGVRPVAVHPLAWWAWALGAAVAVSRTSNPLVVGLLLAAVVLVVLARRDDSPWARGFAGYLVLAGTIVIVRVAFHVLVGVDGGGPVLLDLPRVGLPGWARGIELLGPVRAAGLLAAAAGGLRLGALVVCFGAANALANPRRALRCLPASLHHLGTAVAIAVTVTPQLVTSVARVRRAQRLRGMEGRGPRVALALLLPVLQDSLDQAIALAASMDSRGYARSRVRGGDRRVTAALLLALLAAVVGTYGLLAGTGPLGGVLLVAGAAVAVAASRAAGRQVRRTRYRPDPWGARESVIAGCGLAAALAVVLAATADPAALAPPPGVLAWPALPPLALAAAAATATPALGGAR